MNRLVYAIVKAFNGDKATKTRPGDDEDEEIIDTTKPEFHEQFKGFINTKPTPQPGRPASQQNTQIIMG